jgi:hypothetical protein
MDSERKEPLLPVTRELVDELNRRIPERCPELSMTDREIWYYRGMRATVQLLEEHLKRRTEVSHV